MPYFNHSEASLGIGRHSVGISCFATHNERKDCEDHDQTGLNEEIVLEAFFVLVLLGAITNIKDKLDGT